jgi:3alpha(or 20beta)-hydroxysteroid dehydrogenase
VGDLTDKVAIVTGGSRGMGEAIVRRFHAEGARVVIADVRTAEGAALTTALGDGTVFAELDVSSAAAWQETVRLAANVFEGIDILVNNAGIVHRASIEQTDLDDYLRIVMVNQVGPWLGMKCVLPYMRERGGGSIVITSSIVGVRGVEDRSAYAATKFAVRGMTMVAALEFGRYGIRVNTIVPGVVATPLNADLPSRDGARLPIQRIGRAEEVAELALFLASSRSSFSTGADFYIDGGRLAGL